MRILTIRTDREVAEVGLFVDDQKLAYLKWQAHRQLTETIHQKVDEILNKSSIQLKDLGGIVVFQGPGSFTGLRIGLAVANALAYGLNIPISSSRGDKWIGSGIKKLRAGKNVKIVVPFYGRPLKITRPKN